MNLPITFLIEDFPFGLTEMIALKLPRNDLGNLTLSSRSLLNVCRSNTIWKPLTMCDYPHINIVSNEMWYQTYIRASKIRQIHASTVVDELIHHLVGCNYSRTSYGVVGFILPNIKVLHPYLSSKDMDKLDTQFNFTAGWIRL